MKQFTTSNTVTQRSIVLNRGAYATMFFLSVFFLGLGDYGMAASSLLLALAFDPFDPTVRWKDRYVYQRALPVIHLLVAGSILVFNFWVN